MQELFCSLHETMSITNKELFKIIIDVFSRFQLPIDKCKDQCYDGAANICGYVDGMGKKLIHEKRRAIFVHCRERTNQG